jgi:hypothetical protein
MYRGLCAPKTSVIGMKEKPSSPDWGCIACILLLMQWDETMSHWNCGH